VIRLRDGHIDTAWSARQDIREEVRS